MEKRENMNGKDREWEPEYLRGLRVVHEERRVCVADRDALPRAFLKACNQQIAFN